MPHLETQPASSSAPHPSASSSSQPLLAGESRASSLENACTVCVIDHCTDACFEASCNDQCVVIPCDVDCPEECLATCDGVACDSEAAWSCDIDHQCQEWTQLLACCTSDAAYQNRYDPKMVLDPQLSSMDFSDMFHSYPSVGQSSVPTLPSYTFASSSGVNGVPPTFDSYQQTQLPAYPCLWSGCQERFTSRAHLVDHVNLFHLQLPSQAPATPPLDKLSARLCQWGDCQLRPAANGSSDFMGGQYDLFGLAAHLMHDHLGLTPTTQLVGLPNTLSALGPSSATISNPPHRCSVPPGSSSNPPGVSLGHYACRWKSCGLVFANAAELTNHIRDDHLGAGKALYHCYWADCDRNGEKCLGSKQKALRHIQSHTGYRPFHCKLCDQYFSEAATLQQHLRRHSQEKPYICDYPGCGKAFAITGALTIHKRTHTQEKPFRCKYCDRAFSESSNLSKHLRTHTGARPYPCLEIGCGKKFARPDQLARHLHGVHNKPKKGHVDDVPTG